MIMKSKKGGEKYLSIWWFFVLIIIAIGIVIGVTIFSVREVSVKGVESDILVTRIVDCIIDNGHIDQEFLTGEFNLFESCRISKEVVDEGGDYYLEISKKEEDYLYRYGVPSIKEQCDIGIYEREAPECITKNILGLNDEKEKVILTITAGSKQQGSRTSK